MVQRDAQQSRVADRAPHVADDQQRVAVRRPPGAEGPALGRSDPHRHRTGFLYGDHVGRGVGGQVGPWRRRGGESQPGAVR